MQSAGKTIVAKLFVIAAGCVFLYGRAGRTAAEDEQTAVKAETVVPVVSQPLEAPQETGDAQDGAAGCGVTEEAGEGSGYCDCAPLRVLIQNDGYNGYYHQEIILGTDTCQEHYRAWEAAEQVEGGPGDGLPILVSPEDFGADALTLYSVTRSQGHPSYAGNLEIYSTPQGLVLVNTLEVEEYLRGVLPSEMPAAYPVEALKSQAVCARTYALYQQWMRRRNGGKPHPVWKYADLDDSVSFQVYNNIAPDERADEAIRATAGEILLDADGHPAELYYYSTSALDEAEQEAAWYRWEYVNECMDAERLALRINLCSEQRFGAVSGAGRIAEPEHCRVYGMEVTGTREDGRVERLTVDTNEGTVEVAGEYAVRTVLCDGVSRAVLQDGTQMRMERLLPSAFFTIETVQEGKTVVGYRIRGGGFGHGDGLSQNGAKALAERGNTYREILLHYFQGGSIGKR